MMRPLLALLVMLGPGTVGAADRPAVRAFFEQHCLDCHGPTTKKGGLDLESLSMDLGERDRFARWVKIHDRIRSGAMPPTERERPPANEMAAVLKVVSDDLVAADQARRGAEGRATFRRLTRTELEATLQDLFQLPGMPVKDDLPADGTAAGFDKVSDALDISHVQMARYLDVAGRTLDRAIATRPDAATPLRLRQYPTEVYGFFIGLMGGDCVLLKNKKRDLAYPLIEEALPKEKIHYYLQSVLQPSQSAVGVFRHTDDSFQPSFGKFSPLLPGRYRLRMSVWSFWWDQGQVLPSKKTQVVGLRTARSPIGFYDAPSLDSKVHEIEVWLEPNDQIFFNTASLELVHVYHRKGRAKAYQGPGIAIDWFDIEGPLHDTWPSPGHKLLFDDLPLTRWETPMDQQPVPPARRPFFETRRRGAGYPANLQQHGVVDGLWSVSARDPEQDAARLLKRFLTRAFRRPVTDDQLARYRDLVRERLQAGLSFEESMRLAATAALCAPEFLFRLETPGRLDDWAIASRLSYFLWNSLPDETLLELAQRRVLAKGGETLRQQVQRMLADPRSERFVADFLGQWLRLQDIAATSPDRKLYPEFIPYQEDCMVGETRAFFRHLLTYDLGIRHLADSDFAMLNAEMGKLYELAEAPEGHEFSRVHLPAGSHRGGLLTQAAILKVTANGTVTSPVTRGAWIMDRLLGRPPEPPPPNITGVDPDLRGTTTIREQLDRHRNHASCAGCHRTIDPPGFALESYDVVGRWRERYRSKEKGDPVKAFVGEGHYPVSYRLGPPVDASGLTPDGQPFSGIDEFKQWLLRDERQLAQNFLQRLVTYATGREVSFADRPAIEAILDRCAEGNETDLTNFGPYRMRRLIEEMVMSDLFLMK